MCLKRCVRTRNSHFAGAGDIEALAVTHHRMQQRLALLSVVVQRQHIASHATAVERPVNLLPSRPCCFSLETLATGTAAVFLQFVDAVEIRRVGRSSETRADTEAINWGIAFNEVA
jgi:hypothetical protein